MTPRNYTAEKHTIPGGEIRLNDDGTIDEVVALGVDVHIVQMSDGCFWMSITKDGKRTMLNLFTAGTDANWDDAPAVHANAVVDVAGDGREWGMFAVHPDAGGVDLCAATPPLPQ